MMIMAIHRVSVMSLTWSIQVVLAFDVKQCSKGRLRQRYITHLLSAPDFLLPVISMYHYKVSADSRIEYLLQ